MFTPAQKPRGLARIMFMSPPQCGYSSVSGQKTATPPGEGWRCLASRAFLGARRRLLEINLAYFDHLLAVLFRNFAFDSSFLGFGADFLVVLFAGVRVEVVDGILVAVLHNDHRHAGLFLLEVALGAG